MSISLPRPHPGWMVAVFAVAATVTAWLPWLSTGTDRGWAAAIGGQHLQHRFGTAQLFVMLASALLVSGAVVGRGLSARTASIAALVISTAEGALLVRYYAVNVRPPVSAAYGFYLAGTAVAAALLCSVWALLGALRR